MVDGKRKRQNQKSSESLDTLCHHIWPQERDFMARPERYRYMRKLISSDVCVFCHAANSKPSLETLCVHQTKHSMLVLNKYPYNSGHALVIPRQHYKCLSELNPEEYLDLSHLLKDSIQLVKEVYQCQGFNVGLNLGAVAGAGLPNHIHWHLIPRWHGDTNFFPLIAETKVIPESLETSYEKFKERFHAQTLS